MVAQMMKNLPAMQERQVRSLSQEDSPRAGNGNPFQYSCLENSMSILLPAPGDLPNPGIEPRSPALQVDSLLTEPPGKHIFSAYFSLIAL